MSEVNKKIDVLLVSDDNFDLNEIQNLPEKIIFINTTKTEIENKNYILEFSSEALKVFKTE